jgi:transcriptional regulator with XRE-family HTH domain
MGIVKERLTKLREDRGWSQHDLAGESGVSQPTINRIERGVNPGESQTKQRQLARALGTSEAYLRGETDDPSPDLPPPPVDVPPEVSRTLELALVRMMNTDRYALEDFDAARAAVRAYASTANAAPDATVLLREWLDAARALRLANEPADPPRIMAYTFEQFLRRQAPGSTYQVGEKLRRGGDLSSWAAAEIKARTRRPEIHEWAWLAARDTFRPAWSEPVSWEIVVMLAEIELAGGVPETRERYERLAEENARARRAMQK